MMKILVVDDEKPARDRLVSMIAELPGYETVGEAINGLQAVQASHQSHPDIVLMDIRMPGMDGLEAARHLSEIEHPPAVIFTTAYGEHALEAFDTQAVGYLVKPIRQEKLERALSRARTLTRAQLANLRTQDSSSRRSHICARYRGNLELIPINQVVFFLADQKYITVHHSDGEVLIEDSLKNLETEFQGRLLRIHRNALVSKDYVAGMEKNREGRFQIVFKNNEQRLEVSRRHVADVRRFLKLR